LRSDKVLLRFQGVAIPNIAVWRSYSTPYSTEGHILPKSDLRKSGKKVGGKTPNSKINTQKSQNLRTRSKQRGFTRPKQRWQVGCWLHQCVLRNTLAGSFWWFLCPGMSEIPYQRWPSSLNRGLEMCTFPTNLHGVGCSARPTSRWASKAHRMMRKTH
jgi:hypothetical protein